MSLPGAPDNRMIACALDDLISDCNSPTVIVGFNGTAHHLEMTDNKQTANSGPFGKRIATLVPYSKPNCLRSKLITKSFNLLWLSDALSATPVDRGVHV